MLQNFKKEKRKEKKGRSNKERRKKQIVQTNLDPGQLAFGNTISFLSSPIPFYFKTNTHMKKESKG